MKMWNRLSAAKKELFLLLVMAGFGLVKQFLVYNLPIMAVPKGIHDDWIMVHLADTLRSGQWLGEYNSLTLTKGMFFPLYLAVINFLHLSYLNVTALLYTVGCMVFVYALRPLVPKQLPRLILYLALLWNPISYSLQAFQRVYRNSISYIQVLLIFGGFLAVYLRRREPVRKQTGWIIAAAAGTASFFYTREDAIWGVPFLVVFTLVYLGSLAGLWRKERQKARQYAVKAALVLLPFLCTWAAGRWIARQNLSHYGIEVAKLAGLPEAVVKRSREILEELESTAGRPAPLLAEPAADQVSLGSLQEAEVLSALRRCQPETMTMIEAMNLLYELKQKLN